MKAKTINEDDVIEFNYIDWKGESSKIKVLVKGFAFGEYHEEPQMLLIGFDLDRCETRVFATKDIRL